MKRRIWTVAVGLAALAALIAVPAAMAAYTSAKLEVTQTATGVVVKASLDPNDDPTARVAINVPIGTQLTTTQAPGTVLGPVRAIVKALDLAGADLPLEGQLVVAAPGQVPAGAADARASGRATPLATWVMVLTRSRTDADGADVPRSRSRARALGPAFIAICLPPPDVPAGTPGRATFGAKVYSAELTINGVFSRVATGAWISSWVPYNPGVGTVNVAGAVVVAGGDRTRCGDARREDLRARVRSSPDASRRAVSRARCDRHDLRRPRRRPAHDARSACGSARTGGSRRGSQSGRSSAPTRSRHRRRGAGGVHAAAAADRRRCRASTRRSNGFTAQSKVVRKKK